MSEPNQRKRHLADHKAGHSVSEGKRQETPQSTRAGAGSSPRPAPDVVFWPCRLYVARGLIVDTMAKYAMSLAVIGLSGELEEAGVAGADRRW